MANPHTTPELDQTQLIPKRTAAFWAMFSVVFAIAFGAIGPCCLPIHFNGLYDVIFLSLGSDHDTNNDGLVSVWEITGPTLTTAWLVQFFCIGMPSVGCCVGLLRRQDYGWKLAWMLTFILSAFCAANVLAMLLFGRGHALGTRVLIAADFVAVLILLALLCQPLYRTAERS